MFSFNFIEFKSIFLIAELDLIKSLTNFNSYKLFMFILHTSLLIFDVLIKFKNFH